MTGPCLQYIAKPCQSPASAFCWHRDSDWLRGPQKGGGWPDYISVWVALDDMTEGRRLIGKWIWLGQETQKSVVWVVSLGGWQRDVLRIAWLERAVD